MFTIRHIFCATLFTITSYTVAAEKRSFEEISDSEEHKAIELYALYKDTKIAELKIFQEKHGISYDEPYNKPEKKKANNVFWGLFKKFPIDFALSGNHTDFALFLLNDKKVTVRPGALHDWTRGLSQGEQFGEKEREILALLLKNGMLIDTIDSGAGMTPLGCYIKHAKTYNQDLIKEFFKQGDRILTKEKKEYGPNCNLVSIVLAETHVKDMREKASRSAMLLREGLRGAITSYVNYRVAFSALNREREQKGLGKIPKPLMHLMCEYAVNTYPDDIRNAITDTISVPDNERMRNSRIEVMRYRSISLLEFIDEHEELRSIKELHDLFSPDFWKRPLKACVVDLTNIINGDSLPTN
jgi:hypothetical protein